ncbi:MAG: ABC transporter substrate-binding protein [Rhodobacterales bacterium]|nr:ABC transporter substrate-binding protein [Rhodobacterales bacterium]
MTITRRTLLQTSLASGVALAVPSLLRAQATSGSEEVIWAKGLPSIFDPYTTTDFNTLDYAFGVYDMLFGLDSNLAPQPQMLSSWTVSEDNNTYSFVLRDGLMWHDGTQVTSADCVASIRRWFQTPSGQLVGERAVEVAAQDDKTFTIVLEKPLGVLIDQLAQVVTYPLFIMREQDANRPPSEAVTTFIGSGPYRFNEALYSPGISVTFDKFEEYVPRDDATDGLAGAKIANVKRVIWNNLREQQMAMAALQAGEVDLIVQPSADLFPMIEADPNLVLTNLYKSGYDYFLRMNCLQKPFDNVKARQALLHLVNQEAFLQVINPSQRGNRSVSSLFGTDTAYTNDENTEWVNKTGDIELAKQLLAESGYAGEKVVLLDPTSWIEAHNATLYLGSELRKIGMNVEIVSTDWPGLVARRAKKGPTDQDGWSIFITSVSDFSLSSPISSSYTTMNGEDGWFGWPTSEEYQALRSKWPDVIEAEERQEIAREMQRIWWDYVGWVYLGQVPTLTAYRKELTGVLGHPAGGFVMWNMQKAV